jgi:hypothetical protein
MVSFPVQEHEVRSVKVFEKDHGPYWELLVLPVTLGAGVTALYLFGYYTIYERIIYDPFVGGALIFLFFVIPGLFLVYEIRTTKDGSLVAVAYRKTHHFKLEDIRELKLAIEPEEGNSLLKRGMVSHSRGKLYTPPLSNPQFARLKEFFQFVAAQYPHIKLHEDTEPVV